MNPRIKELAEQSGLKVESWTTNPPKPFQILGGTEQFEKFAELIVRECCDWIDGSPSTDAGQLLLTKSFIIANLKGHFSVGS